jgi:Na+-driven multidrug efflux pump
MDNKEDNSDLSNCSHGSSSQNTSQNSQMPAMSSIDDFSSGSQMSLEIQKSIKKFESSIKLFLPVTVSYLLTNLIDAINLAMVGH